MTSPADADAPAPAQREADGGWGTRIVLGVVGFIIVAEFMLPGFLAAGFSRHGRDIYLENGEVWAATYDDEELPGFSPTGRAELVVLAPAAWLMEHSESIHWFYIWQYRLAGGVEFTLPELPNPPPS